MGWKPQSKSIFELLILLLFLLHAGSTKAQDLEPRRWSHLPAGLNVIGAGLGRSSGDIFFDPVLLAEDVTFDLDVAGLSYVRSFGMFGKSARIDVLAPYASGRWEGYVDGVYTSLRRRGMADPRVRFSVNLYGAPALKGKEFLQYRAENQTNTTIGAAISVKFPLGEYTNERLINLGTNRWEIRPQLGVLHQRKKWQFELTGSVLLFQTNNDFWNDTTLKQDPMWFLQGHAIYSFKPGWWASLSAGFAHGGRSRIDGVHKSDDRRTAYTAVSLGTAIGKKQSLKLAYVTVRTNTSVGRDFDTLLLGWSYHWAR